MFTPADRWSQTLGEAKNAYSSEFLLVSVPPDVEPDESCVAALSDDPGNRPKDKFYATAFRGKQGDSRNKVMRLLWAREGDYWKITAIRLEDGSDAGIVPRKAAAQAEPRVEEPRAIAGDPAAGKAILDFYQTWIMKRDVIRASTFASQRSYPCLPAPSKDQQRMTPIARIQSGLQQPLSRIKSGANLSDMMSSLQPRNDLLPPIQQANSKAFAIMAVPDQKAYSFLCQQRLRHEDAPELKPAEAKYGAYYLSASQLNYGEEESPALLLLWNKEGANWKIVAWAVELP